MIYLYDLIEMDAQLPGQDITVDIVPLDIPEDDYENGDTKKYTDKWLKANDYVPVGATWTSWTLIPSSVYDESQILLLDEAIIRWHVTDDGEVDYTLYEEADGGRLSLPENASKDYIEAMLEEEVQC